MKQSALGSPLPRPPLSYPTLSKRNGRGRGRREGGEGRRDEEHGEGGGARGGARREVRQTGVKAGSQQCRTMAGSV